jgi:uncharacterized protein with von Willebrand factor type A (vWA) domain
MFLDFFTELRSARVPVSIKEYLTLIEAMSGRVVAPRVEEFYYLSRAALVKDERNLDKFDRVFGHVFRGLEPADGVLPVDLPEEWLKALAEKYLTPDEMAALEGLGFEKLMETLKQRLAEQKKRHSGGSKWIGTAGTSPFGAYGYNPEGVRIGQAESRHQRAVKVWDKREFKNLDDDVELGTRNIKIALRRLRKWAREGAPTELDLPDTIQSTAHKGYLDVKLVPERHNTVKVLLFFDVGGSMDPHVRLCEELFSAARSEFKHMEHFYFHNCLYEEVWRDNRRRHDEKRATADVLRTFGADYKVILVGDATMSPYEITYPGGSVEHWNDEPGALWLARLTSTFGKCVWLNPVPSAHWDYTPSIGLINELLSQRMFPLTLAGLDGAMRELGR